MPRQSEGGTLSGATLFCHSCRFMARGKALDAHRKFGLFIALEHTFARANLSYNSRIGDPSIW